MSQTTFEELAGYLNPADDLTLEQINAILSTPFKDVVVEGVIENAVMLANALASAGFMPARTDARARIAIARAILLQCKDNQIRFTPALPATAPLAGASDAVLHFMSELPEHLDIYELLRRID
ncbi:MAG TPA: hypothetical protein VNG90_05010, partial [Candidatus Acidoferrum sp.]|nr:hypothetical protein [Candidatus Acidoferrum sp.]